MNEENNIIKFKYNTYLCSIFLNSDLELIISQYGTDCYKEYYIIIYYDNLNLYDMSDSDYIFNLSNMLYKLHTKDYYSKTYWNKLLI